MSAPGNRPETYYDRTTYALNTQAQAHGMLLQSPAVRQYVRAIEKGMALMRDALAEDSFESLMAVEEAIQKVEEERFAHDEDMAASIQKTRLDLSEGMKDYRQLLENPEQYCARGYRERDRTGPNKQFPLDTMRKALRGQATRVGNFARNPMLFPVEKEFHLLRTALLRRAEKLYENMQAQALTACRKDG